MSETERWTVFTDANKQVVGAQCAVTSIPMPRPTWWVQQECVHAMVCHHASPSPYQWKKVIANIRASKRRWQQGNQQRPSVICCMLKRLEIPLSQSKRRGRWCRLCCNVHPFRRYGRRSWSKPCLPHSGESSCFPKLSNGWLLSLKTTCSPGPGLTARLTYPRTEQFPARFPLP